MEIPGACPALNEKWPFSARCFSLPGGEGGAFRVGGPGGRHTPHLYLETVIRGLLPCQRPIRVIWLQQFPVHEDGHSIDIRVLWLLFKLLGRPMSAFTALFPLIYYHLSLTPNTRPFGFESKAELHGFRL